MRRTSTIYSRTIYGINAPLITIETHISPGLPGFSIVGLPEIAIKESRERVRSAIINSSLDFPARKIIINLAPASLPKHGSKFDLPIALGILSATSQIPNENLDCFEFAGELALTGELRKINHPLLIAIESAKAQRTLLLPNENEFDFLPRNQKIYLAKDLLSVYYFLKNQKNLPIYKNDNFLESNFNDLENITSSNSSLTNKSSLSTNSLSESSSSKNSTTENSINKNKNSPSKNSNQLHDNVHNKNNLENITKKYDIKERLATTEKYNIEEKLETTEKSYTKEKHDSTTKQKLDFQDIYGQHQAKRALLIGAAAKHNILMIGPPGTGKTMLANRITSILPNLTYSEILEIASIYSIKNKFTNNKTFERPFRAPHHTTTKIALVGGGQNPKPGEISLAHNGILFLDELPEFDKKVLECLREPLESKLITVARIKYAITFPANFQLIATMNPCPCGYYGSNLKECFCNPDNIKRYFTKISGPLLDRIDLKIYVSQISANEILTPLKNSKKKNENENYKNSLKTLKNKNRNESKNENKNKDKDKYYSKNITNENKDKNKDYSKNIIYSSKYLKKIVNETINIQLKRANKLNSELTNDEIQLFCSLNEKSQYLLEKAITKFHLSVRSCNKIIKIARTIADLEKSKNIEEKHLCEALSFNLNNFIDVF